MSCKPSVSQCLERLASVFTLMGHACSNPDGIVGSQTLKGWLGVCHSCCQDGQWCGLSLLKISPYLKNYSSPLSSPNLSHNVNWVKWVSLLCLGHSCARVWTVWTQVRLKPWVGNEGTELSTHCCSLTSRQNACFCSETQVSTLLLLCLLQNHVLLL